MRGIDARGTGPGATPGGAIAGTFGDEPPAAAGGTTTALPSGPFFTRKVCEHLVQRTLTPFSVTLSSGILNRVWHCSHWTIIAAEAAV
jgi:hypothetical protein